jgi:C1A family cysteine protease
MKTFALAAFVGAASAISEIESAFLGYITQFGKSYSTMAEYEHRLANFAMKHSFIQGHNAEESSYKLGHNKFSDMTQEEYETFLTYKPKQVQAEEFVGYDAGKVYGAVDFRNGSCLSPVQDQGQCGSCWAFSATASMETAYCQNHGALGKYSEQLLVDCVKLCFGCNGGNAALAWNYLKTHAEMSESSYPYTAKDGTCQYSSSANTGVNATATNNVTPNDPTAMKSALDTTIMSVAIQANQLSFQLYSSGVFTNTNCGTQLDHATNVVGWGTSGSMDYWIMRNSWGASWGESGYMRLEIVSGAGLCGIQMQPNYPSTN